MSAALICLGAAFIYALSSIGFKAAFHKGASAVQATIISNVIMAVIFQFLWLLPHTTVAWERAYLPIISGLIYFLGQWLAFTALLRGDVSLATPLLGLKVLFVPLCASVIFAASLSTTIWVAAGLCFVGLFFLGRGKPRHLSRKDRSIAISYSIIAAGLFALNDVIGQHWAPSFGIGPYLALMSGTMAILSFSFLFPAWKRQNAAPEKTPWIKGFTPELIIWLSLSSIILAIQSLMFAWILTDKSNNVTLLNILYSSRSVWSVVLSAALASMIKLPERNLSPMEMAQRLVGSAFILFSIFLIY